MRGLTRASVILRKEMDYRVNPSQSLMTIASPGNDEACCQ
jgi:hypothetical protein